MKRILLITSFLLGVYMYAQSCTTAVVSGKYTKDGRPMLMKNRDTRSINNVIRYFNAKPYSFIGLVNSHDPKGKSIWIGNNDAGFAIMNSASYNLNVGDTLRQSGLEGRLMKQALQYCKTIEDFQRMLDTISKPYLLEANFGVIDANGGAAYFELNNHKYVKIDANDPTVAPYGYIIRTNFSFTGEISSKNASGYIRYQTASELFYDAVSTNNLNAEFIVGDVFRTLNHSLTKTDLADYGNLPENTTRFCAFRDFIPRSSTSSAVVIQGVKKDENPEFTTLWAVVGFPLTSVVVPFWIKGGENLPEITSYNKKLNDSPICNAALHFKKDCFSYRFGIFNKDYININSLLNADKTGYMQLLAPIEKGIFEKANHQLAAWRKSKISKSEVQDFYSWIDNYVKKEYAEKLNYTF